MPGCPACPGGLTRGGSTEQSRTRMLDALALGPLGLAGRAARSTHSRCELGLEDVGVELLHDLEHQGEAIHEGIDGDAEHSVGGGPVVDPQDAGPLWCCCVRGGCDGGEVPAHER